MAAKVAPEGSRESQRAKLGQFNLANASAEWRGGEATCEVDGASLTVSPALASKLQSKGGLCIEPELRGATTAWGMVSGSFTTFGDRRACGMRDVLKREVEVVKGKPYEKLTLADSLTWTSYKELGAKVDAVAGAWVARIGLKTGDRVLIFAETQRDWMVSAFACWKVGAEIVTSYATLGAEGVATALDQTGARIVVCDAKLWKTLSAAIGRCSRSKLELVVPITADGSSEWTLPDGVACATMPALVAEKQTCDATPGAAADTAVIMYTSGTTGKSKGVVMPHSMIVACCASLVSAIPFCNKHMVFLAYLPLAHIFELFVEVLCYASGAQLGYGSPHTLTPSGVKLKQLNPKQRGDAQVLGPTIMIFAPAVLDKVYVKVKEKFRKGIKKWLFGKALRSGYKRYDQGLIGASPFWNKILMSKVQKLLGGNLQVAITGSAPLSAEIQKFAQSVFNCPVRQGYGLSESCAASCIGLIDDNGLNNVGPVTPGCCARLRDWPEGGYRNADEKDPAHGARRGEVLLGGPTIAAGYLVDPADPDPDLIRKNAEDFITIDGVRYFCTGDVGTVIPGSNALRIIDRKKDLFKGGTGEYVALSKVESALKTSPYVEIPIAVGSQGKDRVIALVQPQLPALAALAKAKGLKCADAAALCADATVTAAVYESLKAESKAAGLLGFETPAAVSLVLDAADDHAPAFTPDNGMLTDTMKPKRPIIAKKYADAIDAAYARAG